jgi:hypothetical protein
MSEFYRMVGKRRSHPRSDPEAWLRQAVAIRLSQMALNSKEVSDLDLPIAERVGRGLLGSDRQWVDYIRCG